MPINQQIWLISPSGFDPVRSHFKSPRIATQFNSTQVSWRAKPEVSSPGWQKSLLGMLLGCIGPTGNGFFGFMCYWATFIGINGTLPLALYPIPFVHPSFRLLPTANTFLKPLYLPPLIHHSPSSPLEQYLTGLSQQEPTTVCTHMTGPQTERHLLASFSVMSSWWMDLLPIYVTERCSQSLSICH